MRLLEFLLSLTALEFAVGFIGVVGALTAIIGLFEKVLKVNGLTHRLYKLITYPYSFVKKMSDSVKNIELKLIEYGEKIEIISHEVQTNSESSLKDAVKNKEAMIIDLVGLVKNQNNDIHTLKQTLGNEEKFSSNLRFSITPTGISKSNHAAKALFGYPESDDAGATISWQNSIPRQQRNNVIQQWRYAWENKAIFESDFYVLHSERNRAFYCHVEAVPIYDLDGKLLMHSGSIAIMEKDITIDDLKRRLREDVQF